MIENIVIRFADCFFDITAVESMLYITEILYPLLKNRENIVFYIPDNIAEEIEINDTIKEKIYSLYSERNCSFLSASEKYGVLKDEFLLSYNIKSGKKEDIYIPMGISFVNSEGKISNIETLELIIDDFDEVKILQSVSDILKAEKDFADASSDFVWILSDDEEIEIIEKVQKDGFPVSTFTRKDNFTENNMQLFKKSILIVCDEQEDKIFAEKIDKYIDNSGKVIKYNKNNADAKWFIDEVKQYGYIIEYAGEGEKNKFSFSRSDNGLFVSVYSPDTTVECNLKFPVGAPVFSGFETKLTNGIANYRFTRCEHMECRVFVEQDNGVVGFKEQAPVNWYFRRRAMVYGLNNATVRFFGEEYAKDNVKGVLNSFGDMWYDADEFEWETVESEEYGTYYEAKNVTGTMVFSMPFPEKIKEV